MLEQTLSPVSLEEIEAQTAIEVPERRMLALVNVVLLNGSIIQVPIGVAANLCGINANVLAHMAQHGGTASCSATNPVTFP